MAPVIEIRPASTWVDITSDHKAESGLATWRGRKNATDVTNSSYDFVLKNDGGKYSSDVPGSTYYGTLGRGTPIRVRERIILDRFTRTTSSGWGSTSSGDTEQPYPALAWSNGSGSATDYSTTGTVARHTLTTTNVARQSRLDLVFTRLVVKTSVTIGATATGAPARAAVVVRKDDLGTAHFRMELEYSTSGAVTANIVRLGGPSTSTLATTAVGAYSGGTKWWIVAAADTNNLFMWAWQDGSAEPLEPTLTASGVHFTRGQVALRSMRDTSNSNSNLTVDFDDFEILLPDFYGEIWGMTPMGGEGGADLTMTVQAGGVLQRMSNTDKPLRSPIYRSVTGRSFINLVDPAAYWPMEDGKLASSLEQAVTGAREARIHPAVTPAADNSLPGSGALPNVPPTATISGDIPAFPTGYDALTDDWTVLFLLRIDEVPSATTVIARFATYGPTLTYELAMDTSGNLLFRGQSPPSALGSGPYVWTDSEAYTDTTLEGESLFGRWAFFQMFNIDLGGGSYTAGVQWADALTGDNFGFLESSTLSVAREPRGTWVMAGPPEGNRGFGHLSVWPGIETLDERLPSGWVSEFAISRLSRFAAEENIPFRAVGASFVSARMGPQPSGTAVNVVENTVTTDLGVMLEDRIQLGLNYRGKQSLYNQRFYELPFSLIADGMQATRADTRGMSNQVTATRTGGTPQVAAILDGDVFHLTSEDPPDGVGLVPSSASPNVETDQDAVANAGWRVHLAAYREPRFENVTVNLHAVTDVQTEVDLRSLSEGDLVRLVDAPLWWEQTHPPGPTDLMVQGIQRTSDGVADRMTLATTAGSAWEVWCVDSAGSDLTAGISTSDTLLRVQTQLGAEWDEFLSDAPFGIAIGGEAMAVNAVSTLTPTFIAAGTIATGNNASVVPGLPAGMVADTGQSMYCQAAIRNSGTGVPNQPAGWTTVVDNGCMKVFHKFYVTGDAAPTISFTGGVANADTMARITAFSNLSNRPAGASAATLSLWRSPAAANQLNGSAQNIAYPAYFMHNRDNSVVMIFAWKQDDWTGVAPPAGFTEAVDNSTTTGDDAGIAMYYQIQTTSTNTASGSLVVTGGASAISRASIVAFRPQQTLTVERSVNEVAATHSAGDGIHTWRHGAVPL